MNAESFLEEGADIVRQVPRVRTRRDQQVHLAGVPIDVFPNKGAKYGWQFPERCFGRRFGAYFISHTRIQDQYGGKGEDATVSVSRQGGVAVASRGCAT